MDINKAMQAFEEYVETFDLKEKFIRLKKDHSYRVMNIMEEIARNLNLTKEQIELAALIGLLHDIGRFYQIEQTHGFNDQKLDHSDYGVQYLFEHGHIRNFLEDNQYDEIIKKAIQYHNDISLEAALSKEESLFCKMIRDADKIDIYKVYVEEFQHQWNHFDITPTILEDFQKRKLINIKEKRTKSDSVMIVLAFLYDINFPESFQILEEKGYFTDYINHVQVQETSKNEWRRLTNFCIKIIERRDIHVREEI